MATVMGMEKKGRRGRRCCNLAALDAQLLLTCYSTHVLGDEVKGRQSKQGGSLSLLQFKTGQLIVRLAMNMNRFLYAAADEINP